MKTNVLPKLILFSILSMLIYSCTAEDVAAPQEKTSIVLKTGDTITQPGLPNPKG